MHFKRKRINVDEAEDFTSRSQGDDVLILACALFVEASRCHC